MPRPCRRRRPCVPRHRPWPPGWPRSSRGTPRPSDPRGNRRGRRRECPRVPAVLCRPAAVDNTPAAPTACARNARSSSWDGVPAASSGRASDGSPGWRPSSLSRRPGPERRRTPRCRPHTIASRAWSGRRSAACSGCRTACGARTTASSWPPRCRPGERCRPECPASVRPRRRGRPGGRPWRGGRRRDRRPTAWRRSTGCRRSARPERRRGRRRRAASTASRHRRARTRQGPGWMRRAPVCQPWGESNRPRSITIKEGPAMPLLMTDRPVPGVSRPETRLAENRSVTYTVPHTTEYSSSRGVEGPAR